MQEYFQPKIGRKSKNIQPGPEKQHSYKKKKKKKKKECISLEWKKKNYRLPGHNTLDTRMRAL